MSAAPTYKIRMATPEDAPNLRRLAALDSQRPVGGAVLIGEINGVPAAALELATGRHVADPFRPTADLVTTMRVRAAALAPAKRTSSLRERLHAVLFARPAAGAA